MSDLTRKDECPRCGGDGYVASGPVVGGCAMVAKCPKCEGTGKSKTDEGTHFRPGLVK